VRLDQSALVLLPALAMDGRQYVVQLESTLGRTLFDSAAARATFTANASAQVLLLFFHRKYLFKIAAPFLFFPFDQRNQLQLFDEVKSVEEASITTSSVVLD